MSPEEHNSIKERIQAEIEQLSIEIDSLSDASNPVEPNVSLGRLTRMDAIQGKSVREASLNSNIEKREKLRKRLLEIDRNDFGKCIKCGEPIPVARLLYIPETDTCVNCQ